MPLAKQVHLTPANDNYLARRGLRSKVRCENNHCSAVAATEAPSRRGSVTTLLGA